MDSNRTIKMDIPCNLRSHYVPVAVLKIENGCCPGKPVIVTANNVPAWNEHSGYINFSAQCACGGWCTSGHRNVSEVLRDWEQMNERAKHRARAYEYYGLEEDLPF